MAARYFRILIQFNQVLLSFPTHDPIRPVHYLNSILIFVYKRSGMVSSIITPIIETLIEKSIDVLTGHAGL